MTMVAICCYDGAALVAGFVPCLIDGANHAVPVHAGNAEGQAVLRYMDEISRVAGLPHATGAADGASADTSSLRRKGESMRVGVPKEIKDNEYRVGLVPSSVAELVHHGHTVLVERGAGLGAGLTDEDYGAAGATLAEGPDRVFAEAELVVKVKEPLPNERKKLRAGRCSSPICISRRI